MIVSRDDILRCSFSKWHSQFSHATLPSRIVPLSAEFIEYLNQDGVFLPLDSNGMPQPSYDSNRDDDDADSQHSDSDNSEQDAEWARDKIPSFPELTARIADEIESLGGVVFPKLNWSSPKDASWMTLDGTLRCKTSADIFLLLKSSDFIAHDLTCPFDACSAPNETETPDGGDASTVSDFQEYELILRKWYDLNPSMEFRCFVGNHVLLGACQRDVLNYYPFLVDTRGDLLRGITQFFEKEIQGKFASSDYVFDVYINKNTRKVWLIDFNPFSTTTDSLLYDWEELSVSRNDAHEGSVSVVPQLRVVTGANSSHNQPAYATNRIPKDVVDFSDGQSIAEFARVMAEQMAESLNVSK
ncbi:hypothetical protein HDU78_003933 [Chytriomyces hyalinus]|nr:hypothetical protein HDU78_003933 [Chytriomyces hyalinus]